MKRFSACLAGWLLLLAILSGCGFKDIDRRFFVMAIGIDKSHAEEKAYRVSLKLAVPFAKIQPGETNTYRLVSDDASSIAEAVRHIKSKVDKELDFTQSKMIVVGKDVSDELLREDLLDWFLRRRDIQSASYMAVGDPSAEAVLNVKTNSERFPGDSLFLSFDQDGTESSFIATEHLFDFHRRVREKGIDPYLPVIRTIDDGAFLIDQVAVFDEERMKAVLSADETRIFNELVERNQNFDVETKTDKVQFALNVHRFRYDYKIQASPPAIHLKGRIVAQAEESTEAFYTRPWSYYEQLAERQTETRYARLLQKLQRLNVDPVGFGLRYRATRYGGAKEWKAWQALYPKVTFHPKVSIDIKSSGGIK
ncbi:Ger(x)C family spore germination protein [Paenibacillus sp. MWE-103]|uniref:Ger(X)C family spore germination protein n=1 Tax=Paenibacillus artemisiicola TaxID=1172618 RepID=A0ABS3W396_9BACL|nr:Ger(x)C family spore germination protein [Paenibacillus artemisiicola]MBO7742767.1 Ger(x)C family spore germination protein [Paenibacillus artemisiicola]